MSNWLKYRKSLLERDGLWLVRLRSGDIHLGRFCFDDFVQDGKFYNQTHWMIDAITHLKAVTPPNSE